MRVIRKRYLNRTPFLGRFATFIKVEMSPQEKMLIRLGSLQSARIRDRPGLAVQATSIIHNRIRNRWNASIEHTSGVVFLDRIYGAFTLFALGIGLFFRNFFGTTIRFSDLEKGAEFRSWSVEGQREIETHIFVSIAAITRAVEFMKQGDASIEITDGRFSSEVPGLVFADALIQEIQHDKGNKFDNSVSNIFAEADIEDENDLDVSEPEIYYPSTPPN